MSKSPAEYKTARRKRAVADGLCLTCCATPPPAGRSVCAKCSAAASSRTLRRRRTIVDKIDAQRGIEALETLGDSLSSDGEHGAALKTYRRAFDLCSDNLATRTRLAGKVGRSAVHHGVASETDDWFKISVEAAIPASAATSIAQLHMQQMRALWLSGRFGEVLPLTERLLDFAIASKNAYLILSTRLRLVSVLTGLWRFAEAEGCLQAVDVATLRQDHSLLWMYERCRGMLYAAAGNDRMAFASFANAIEHAQRGGDAHTCVSIYTTNAEWATALGRIDLGANCLQEALDLARRNNMTLAVAHVLLDFAKTLSLQGNRQLAHAYVTQATAFEEPPTSLVVAFAECGIPVAIESDDTYLLERCANEEAMAFAFRSGEVHGVANVAASAARYYRKIGKAQKAQEALAKGLKFLTNAEQSYELALAVAEFGDARLFPHVREVLRARMLLPNAEVAAAHNCLFGAHVFGRNGHREDCTREAAAAAVAFKKLGWTSRELAARSLGASFGQDADGPKSSGAPTVVVSGLTQREQNVANLAIAGLSNREIALKLSISSATVEAHMTSILRQTGLRSRHQLFDAARR